MRFRTCAAATSSAPPETPIGTKVGQKNVSLVDGQAPPAWRPGGALRQRQPSLAIRYLVALQGFSQRRAALQPCLDTVSRSVRQLSRNSSSFRAVGPCDGSILAIHREHGVSPRSSGQLGWNPNEHLRAPDLRNRIVIGAGSGFLAGRDRRREQHDGHGQSAYVAQRSMAAPRHPAQFGRRCRLNPWCRSVGAIRSPGRTAPPTSTPCGPPTPTATGSRKCP